MQLYGPSPTIEVGRAYTIAGVVRDAVTGDPVPSQNSVLVLARTCVVCVVPALAAKMPNFISRWVSAHGCLEDDRVIFVDIVLTAVQNCGAGECRGGLILQRTDV